MSSVRPKVCIVAHRAYGAVQGVGKGHFGGVEIQTAALAKWLAAQGYETSVVTWNEDGRPDDVVGEVRVLKVCAPNAGRPVLRFLHPRTTSLLAALERANADIYYHNCAEAYTGLIAAWCAVRRRTFVYSTASDADCRRARPPWQSRHERLLYRFGLRIADMVIAQTRNQVSLLQRECGVSAALVPMPGAFGQSVPASTSDWLARRGGGGIVAWVGRIDPRKRLEYLFEIARLMPQTTFRVVAPATKDSDYERAIEAQGRSIPNIEWLGRVSRECIGAVYRQADCLCCTSLHEGFPNTFLEAWSQGTPVISSFDPDGLIAERQLGVCAGTVSAFIEAIALLSSSEREWHARSSNALRYYQENHSPEIALPKLEAMLLRAWTRDLR